LTSNVIKQVRVKQRLTKRLFLPVLASRPELRARSSSAACRVGSWSRATPCGWCPWAADAPCGLAGPEGGPWTGGCARRLACCTGALSWRGCWAR